MSTVRPVDIRNASAQDLLSIHQLYSHHVSVGTGSFEEIPPSPDDIRQRWLQRESGGYPTLVASVDGQFAGFAYANAYKSRSAYRYTVEDSIYVCPEWMGCGVGVSLLSQLISRCTDDGYRQMMAIVGDSANIASIALHERCGFRHIGVAKGLGCKFGRWLDIVYMQRALIDTLVLTSDTS